MLGDLNNAAFMLRSGGVIAYATEYCFGFGCNPFDRTAVQRLLHIKNRMAAKGLIVLASDMNQLSRVVSSIPDHVAATWPGPHTWLLTPTPDAPRWITGRHAKIAVRVTAHPQAAALCRAAGMAIVSTSANRAGEAPARTDREVIRRFGNLVDCVLRGRVGDAPAPTPIRDGATGTLIRSGGTR